MPRASGDAELHALGHLVGQRFQYAPELELCLADGDDVAELQPHPVEQQRIDHGAKMPVAMIGGRSSSRATASSLICWTPGATGARGSAPAQNARVP